MNPASLRCTLALTLSPGIGLMLARKLIHLCGSAENVFNRIPERLREYPRLLGLIRSAKHDREIWKRADEELRFIEKFRLQVLVYGEKGYPVRLAQCYDAPVLLFYKGNAGLNAEKIIGIVGTRSATDYGKQVTADLIRGLGDADPLVVSGLAYGIDSNAHRSALECGLKTVGVLGHGLDRLYPSANQRMAEHMIRQGGLLTEFFSGTGPDRENFPQRNRVIAGLCDAIVVVEAAREGGALITADIALSYDRAVFAVPGRAGDKYSEGCNNLIMTNQAALVQKAEDILAELGWKTRTKNTHEKQPVLFVSLSRDEELIVNVLRKEGELMIDEISRKTMMPVNKVASALLNLELENVIRCKPGKIYEIKASGPVNKQEIRQKEETGKSV